MTDLNDKIADLRGELRSAEARQRARQAEDSEAERIRQELAQAEREKRIEAFRSSAFGVQLMADQVNEMNRAIVDALSRIDVSGIIAQRSAALEAFSRYENAKHMALNNILPEAEEAGRKATEQAQALGSPIDWINANSAYMAEVERYQAVLPKVQKPNGVLVDWIRAAKTPAERRTRIGVVFILTGEIIDPIG